MNGRKSADILFDIFKGKQMNIKLKLSNEVIRHQSSENYKKCLLSKKVIGESYIAHIVT